MARVGGVNGDVTFDGDGMMGLTAISFDYEGEAVEVTGMDSTNGWREYVRGRYRASYEYSAHWETTAGDFPDETDIYATTGKPLVMNLGNAGAMRVTTTGSAFMTGFDPSAAVDGAVDYTVRGVIVGTAPAFGTTT